LYFFNKRRQKQRNENAVQVSDTTMLNSGITLVQQKNNPQIIRVLLPERPLSEQHEGL
jgi:hypothetical protein